MPIRITVTTNNTTLVSSLYIMSIVLDSYLLNVFECDTGFDSWGTNWPASSQQSICDSCVR